MAMKCHEIHHFQLRRFAASPLRPGLFHQIGAGGQNVPRAVSIDQCLQIRVELLNGRVQVGLAQ